MVSFSIGCRWKRELLPFTRYPQGPVAGDPIEVCGYCTSIASLLNEGAKAENVVTKASDVLLISSTDEATIANIHAHAQKTIDFVEAASGDHND